MKSFSNHLISVKLTIAAVGLVTAIAIAKEVQEKSPTVGSPFDRIIHVPAFDLPLSGLLSAETLSVLERQAEDHTEMRRVCSPILGEEARNRCVFEYYLPAHIARHRMRYKVIIRPETIAGVSTTIITPADGVLEANRHRVLINVPGGDPYTAEGNWRGQVESIPIAAVGKIKVVSVNYRVGSGRAFPAAREGVPALYKALLTDYQPENIGIYGASVGAMEEQVWFHNEGLPAPGAIGVISAPPFLIPATNIGDSTNLYKAINAHTAIWRLLEPVKGSALKNAMVFPELTPEVVARFPHMLLVTATRDLTMSSIVATHSHLAKLGVKADLRVWEGLVHNFHYDSDLPESREVYDVIVRFFGEHLGK